MKTIQLLTPMLAALSIFTAAAVEPSELDAARYRPDRGVIFLQANWGRRWGCGAYQNAQLQALSFSPLDGKSDDALELATPSRLFVADEYRAYAFVVEPGRYALSAFDVKMARSIRDVVHFRASTNDTIKNGKALAGEVVISPGEVTYIGHFGLDCTHTPIPWRYYVESRTAFLEYVASFRKRYPFMAKVPVRFRLLETESMGERFFIADPVVD